MRVAAPPFLPSSRETLDLLLRAMGERLELTCTPLEWDYDPVHRRAAALTDPDGEPD